MLTYEQIKKVTRLEEMMGLAPSLGRQDYPTPISVPSSTEPEPPLTNEWKAYICLGRHSKTGEYVHYRMLKRINPETNKEEIRKPDWVI